MAPGSARRLPPNPPPKAADPALGRVEITLPDRSHVLVDNDVSLDALSPTMMLFRVIVLPHHIGGR